MSAPRFLLVACSLVLYALTQPAPPAHAGQADGEANGLVRSELTLNGRRVSVAYDPALPSDHRSLLVLRAGSTQAAVRLGRLEGHRSLAIGTLAPDPDEPRGPVPDHDLWLMRTAAGWVLDARPVEEAADPSDGGDATDPSGEDGSENAPDAADADAPGPAEADATEANSPEATPALRRIALRRALRRIALRRTTRPRRTRPRRTRPRRTRPRRKPMARPAKKPTIRRGPAGSS